MWKTPHRSQTGILLSCSWWCGSSVSLTTTCYRHVSSQLLRPQGEIELPCLARLSFEKAQIRRTQQLYLCRVCSWGASRTRMCAFVVVPRRQDKIVSPLRFLRRNTYPCKRSLAFRRTRMHADTTTLSGVRGVHCRAHGTPKKSVVRPAAAG